MNVIKGATERSRHPVQKTDMPEELCDADWREDIDYLHPFGKPKVSECQKLLDLIEQTKPICERSISEADGHHMCSQRCKSKHQE